MRVFRHRHTLGLFTLFAFAMQVVLALAETHTHNTALAQAEGLATRAFTVRPVPPERRTALPCPHPAR